MTAGPPPLPGLDHEEPPEQGRPRVVCRDCGGQLTDPESRRWGRGPDCRRKLGLRAAPRPGGFDVEQETLPEA